MEKFIPFILAFEAGLTSSVCCLSSNMLRFHEARATGYSDDPNDPGGATQCGVTLATYAGWCAEHGEPKPTKLALRHIPYRHWRAILEEKFWRASGGDRIAEPLAWIITDWVWASGPKVLKRVQGLVGAAQDGIFGPKTISSINFLDPEWLFDLIKDERRRYIDACIARNPKLERYRKGWQRRLEAITFTGLKY